MKFTIYGLIENKPVELTWDDGLVEGDRMAINELIALAEVLEGKLVGPEPDGPFTAENHLSDPLSAQVLMEDVFDEITGAEGAVPQAIELPPGRAAA